MLRGRVFGADSTKHEHLNLANWAGHLFTLSVCVYAGLRTIDEVLQR